MNFSIHQLFRTVLARSASSKNRRNVSNTIQHSGHFIDVNGHRTHYIKVGRGKQNLLLIPGIVGAAHIDFAFQIAKLNKDAFTIIGWDPPGLGYSRPPNRIFSMNHFRDESNAASDFLKAMNITKTSVLGWSGGGPVALLLAANNPNVVEKLVVSGTPACIKEEELEKYEVTRDLNNWPKSIRHHLTECYGEDYLQRIYSDMVDYIGRIMRSGGNICLDRLPHIGCPTLILHGNRDNFIQPFHGELLHKNIKNSRYIIYENGGHYLPMQFHERFNKDVEEFLTN